MTKEPRQYSQAEARRETGRRGVDNSEAEVPSTSASETTRPSASPPLAERKPATKKGPKFDDFEAFVRYAYSRKGQRVSLTKKDALHLAEAPMPEEAVFGAALADLVQADRLLAVPAQFFLAGIAHRRILPFWRQVERTYCSILRQHAASAAVFDSLQAARAEGAPNWPVIEAVSDPFYIASLSSVAPDKNLKKSEASRLQGNVIFNVVLWLTQLAKADLRSVVQALHRYRWSSALATVPKELDRLRLLQKLTDDAAAGLVASAFVADAEEQRDAAKAAAAREAETAAALADAQHRADVLGRRVEELTARVRSLQGEIKHTVEQHDAALAHAADDHERMRSRLVRRIEDEVDLLQEGLSALRRDPPKTHVMEDHAERAISGLRSELRSLSDGSPP